MLKIMKKTISLFIIAAMLVSVMPVVSMAAGTPVNIGFINGRATRLDKPSEYQNFSTVTYLPAQASSLTSAGTWNSYFQADFTGNVDLLKDPNTQVTFTMTRKGTLTPHICETLYFYAVDNEADAYASISNMTYNQAPSILHTVTDEQFVAGVPADAPAVTYSYNVTSAGKNAIIKALESGTDSIVTFTTKTAASNTAANYYRPADARSMITLTKLSDEEHLNRISTEFSWDAIFEGMDKSAVTSNLFLPSTFEGATVIWSSDDVTIGTDNKISLPRDNDKTISLTATLKYNDYTSEPITISDITLKKDELQKVQIAATYSNNVRSLYADKISKYSASDANTQFGTYQQFEIVSGGINAGATEENPKGDALAFMQFDLSDYNKIIDAAQSIALVTPSATGKCQGTTGIVTLLNDSSDNWNGTNMTYNYAVNNGMYSDPGLYTKTEINFTDNPVKIEDADLLSAVKTAVAQDPDEGIISFRFSAADSNLCKLYSGLAAWGDAPYVEISYYGSDLKSAEEFADTMTWDAVSTQDINNVVADLELPSTWYGLPVSWESNNSAISNDGTVAIGDTAATGKLIATVAGKTNEFNVTVPAKNIAVKSDSMYSIDEIANLNYSTGYVYANEAVPTPCTAIIATYNAEGALVGITVKNNVTINEGKNIITPTIGHTAFAGAETKLILVDNLTNLTPLAIAK